MTLATADWLAERCYRPVDSDCLIWKGRVDRRGSPVAWTPKDQEGKRSWVAVRRDAWVAKNGPVPKGLVVTTSCGNPRCLCHLEAITKAEVIRRQWARMEIRVTRSAGTAEASRRRGKLDMEKARYIRESGATLVEIAGELGISAQTASQVRRGLAWKEDRNPFAGLMA